MSPKTEAATTPSATVPAPSTPDFFVAEDTVQLELAPGYWVELKRQLDYGELVELEGTLFRGMSADDATQLQDRPKTLWRTDSANFYVLRLALYIVDWNLPGPSGKVLALPSKLAERMRVIRSLNPRWAGKIVARIDELEAEATREAAAEVDPEGNPTSDSEQGGGSKS